jgi:hypothetical protein
VSEAATEPGRTCAGCTACCHILPIIEVDVQKPANATCVNCIVGVGCGIYETRYHVCRRFMCDWVLQETIGQHWRPAESHMVLVSDDETSSVVVHVDTAYSQAWRHQPFIGDLRAWAAASTPTRRRVLVRIGDDFTVIFPNGEKFIGPMRPDQALLVHKIVTTFWTAYDAEVVDSSDPRAGRAAGRPRITTPGALRLDLPAGS